MSELPFDPLDPLELRVLGVLLEKELSTPEYYPLTLNALVNGCNQSSNRAPVLHLDETAAQSALDALRDRHLAATVQGAGARTLKFAQRITAAQNLSVQEAALLAELLLRGPQTPGELRSRCTRMYPFQDLEEVDAALSLMAEAEPAPLVVRLPRAPGMKESRYAQLLGGPVEFQAAPVEFSAAPAAADLAAQVAALTEELAGLRAEFEAFKRQFE
jgi:hypothetical protein